ncbi:MAG: hypothetical protein IKN94_09680 [Salinivirgaceae bacterium]|nr:hypothetical protein [Salinivirgaceae bacterium]
MIVTYLIVSILIALLLFVNKSRALNGAFVGLFMVLQCALTVFEFTQRGNYDAVYFKADSLALLMLAVLTVVAVPALLHKFNYVEPEAETPRSRGIYYGAMVLLVMALSAATLSSHIAVTWIFVEVTTLSASALVFHRRNAGSIEATWKYIFVCSISLVFVFIGILLVSISLGAAGQAQLQYDSLMRVAADLDPFWIKIAFVFIFAGYTAKFGLLPMYTAGIDAKDKAPAPAAALFSSVLMNVGFVGIFRFYQIVARTSVRPWADTIIMVVAVLSILISAVYLIKVKNIKRMLAYSSVEHMGVVALGLAAGGVGCFAAILHLVLHSFAKSAMFFHTGHIYKYFKSKNIYSIGNYFGHNRAGAVFMLLAFVCIAAMPPSGLFVSELLTFKALIASHHILALVIVLVLLTTIIWALGRNILKMLFVNSENVHVQPSVRHNVAEMVMQYLLLALTVWLGFCPPQWFVDLIEEAVQLITF